MPADSTTRRLLKRALAPLLKGRSYQMIQSCAKAWDIRIGGWTEPECRLIPLAVQPGETALDIGANFGLYCYHLSRAVGKAGRVVAFEPVPFTSETLKRVLALLRVRNVEVVPKGCSDRTERVAFRIPIQESGAWSAGLTRLAVRNDERAGKESHTPYARTAEVLCDVVSLDEFLPGVSNVALIKCDIEGAELLALRGAARLIERCAPTVLCEINAWFLEGFGIAPREIEDFFSSRGYRMYAYLPGGPGRLHPTTMQALGADGMTNYLFVHPSRLARFRALLPQAELA